MNPKKPGLTSTASSETRGIRHFLRHAVWVLVPALAFTVLLADAAWPQDKPAATPTTVQAADTRLLQLKRICMDEFLNTIPDKQLKEMLIAQLFGAKRFALTEKCETADHRMMGTVTQQRQQVSRSESEGLSAGREAVGAAANSGSVAVGAAGAQLSAHESLSSSEMKEHAVVTLRLSDMEGEIIWAISLESDGGKTKGAVGDAAERAIKRLLRDIERAEEAQKQEKLSQSQPSKQK